MKCAFLAVAALCAARCFGVAASQAWVEAYVSNFVTQTSAVASAQTRAITTNGVTTVSAPGGAILTMEQPTDYALRVVSSASPSYADGTLFVWNGAGAFVARQGVVYCTATNMVCEGVGSAETADGLVHFEGLFAVKPVRVQPSVSLAATNAVKGVAR